MLGKKRFFALGSMLLILALIVVGCSGGGEKAADADKESEATWPEKAVTIIVSYNPGGSTDVFARILAKSLEQILGQPVVVTNVPGGGGAVGFAQTLGSKPDGYTLTVSNGALLTLAGLGNVDFDYESFDNIARVITEDITVVVRKDAPWNNINEFVEYAKQNPGKVKAGFAGTGSFTYLSAQQFLNETGIELEGVGYGGGSESVAGLLGGFVDVIFQHPGEIYSQWKAGEVKALAIMGSERNAMLEDVPTLKEEGIDLELYQWRGISAPKGTPEEAIQVLSEAIEEVANDPEFEKSISENLCATVNYNSGESFNSWLKEETEWIYPLIESLGLKEDSK